MTSQDGSKARAIAICIGPARLQGMTGMMHKKRLAAAHFIGKTRRNINALAGEGAVAVLRRMPWRLKDRS
jgi:hypothetical protein